MNLKYYLQMGMVCTKINSAIKFKQKKLCDEFIARTTKLRAKAKTKTERNLCKFKFLFLFDESIL